MPAGPELMISYRRGDAGYAHALYYRLTARYGKASVHMDVDSIRPGADFAEVIRTLIQRSVAMIIVIGPNWQVHRLEEPDDFVRMEVESALERSDMLVLPVLVGGTPMP